MKQFLYTILFIISTLQLHAQHTLESHLNMLRPGDELIKQQVSYKDPGRAGEHVLWDFSQLKIENTEYKLQYSLHWDSVIIGSEHYTKYRYLQKQDSLFLLGHTNPVVSLNHLRPVPILRFPFVFGDNLFDSYQAEGLYSKTVPLETSGFIKTEADASGKMLLPSGDRKSTRLNSSH